MSVLATRTVAKPWGRVELPAPFTNGGPEAIGEIWFEPAPELDGVLVKYIFTSENLSVQCHPSDAQTLAKGQGRQGKEECWLVLEALPDARLAIGFLQPVDVPTMRAAALDGSIVDMLDWHPVAAGDFFYIPANTVHAIGAGVTLVEVQQNSDITYRIFDYGRPRELHLDEGLAVALGEPYPAHLHRKLDATGPVTLVDGPFFRLDRLDGNLDAATLARYRGTVQVIPLDCAVAVNGIAVVPGQSAVTGAIDLIDIPPGGLCLITQEIRAS